LSVHDTGVGIPPDELSHVFDRFYRVRGARGRTHEGTGIGLSLVRELVGLHGGRIEVEFPADGGARFIVSLPTGLPGREEAKAP
jgi:signal transduction histidine kinase